ncbi:MAG: hypothetical protein HY897_23015 [Deltaproteobacteria bacterium]|nr:hypothetical protein [Deltaproteobacteria bacterium]
MKSVVWLAVALSLLLVAAVAVAQPEKREITQRQTHVTFDEVTIDGVVKGPTGTIIVARPTPKFPKLIELRSNFDPEILKSIDRL